MNDYPTYGRLAGPVVMIGFGSIGRGALPLILRHFDVAPAGVVVVAPDTGNDALLDQMGVRKLTTAITGDNYRALLTPLLRSDQGQPFCVNLSVDTSSVAILSLCRQLEALYVDTVIEPWRASTTTPMPLSKPAPTTHYADTPGRAGYPPGGATAVQLAGRTRGWCPGSSSRRSRCRCQGWAQAFGADQPRQSGRN